MSIRKIIQSNRTGGTREDEKILRSVSTPVSNFGEELNQLVQDLSDTMWHYPICVGLAAAQIGVTSAVAVVNYSRDRSIDDLVIINPEIISTSGKKDKKRESCMSVWGYMGEVESRNKLTLRYQNLEGDYVTSDFRGYEARVILHEVSHLNGKLYFDNLVEGCRVLTMPIFDGLERWSD